MTSLAAYEEQCPGGQSSKTLQQEAFLEKEGETEKNEPENDQANAPKRHRFTEKVFLHPSWGCGRLGTPQGGGSGRCEDPRFPE